MRFLFSVVLILSGFFGQAQSGENPYVLLISMDGFRHDYVERYDLPNFKAFIREGVAAKALIPSFPSKTFPNHYSIVTGLYPGHHGLVDNQFYDEAQKKTYAMKLRDAVTDSSFYGGTPLWQLARKNNIVSASYFWVGSELKEETLHPDYYLRYDMSVPFGKRVDQVLEWLKLPEKNRPHMITLYFSSPDTESHKYGPLSEETRSAVLSMDTLLGNLVKRIDETRLPVNIIIVSDHGMLELTDAPETYINLNDFVASSATIKDANGGTQAHIYTESDAQTDSLYAVLQRVKKGFSVYRQRDFPKEWHYNHPRSGDLLILAEPGKYFVSGWRDVGLKGGKFGVHGYDPFKVKDMRGIFYAKGPHVRQGKTIPAFQNIHIYPFITKILGVKTGKIDGKTEVLEKIYKP